MLAVRHDDDDDDDDLLAKKFKRNVRDNHMDANVVYWPPTPAKHAIPKTAEVHIPLARASLADNMGQG